MAFHGTIPAICISIVYRGRIIVAYIDVSSPNKRNLPLFRPGLKNELKIKEESAVNE